HTSTLDQIEALIRTGREGEARRALGKLRTQRVERNCVTRLAHLARRARMPELSISVLNRLIRPSRKLYNEATSDEKLEYAASLIKIGALHEAGEILDELPQTVEGLHFQKAVLAVNQWDYRSASKHFKHYIREAPQKDYGTLVARVNLAAALVGSGQY